MWWGLRDVGNLVDNLAAEQIVRTGSYASGFTIFKPWLDAIGLKGGYVLAPVSDVSEQGREELLTQLQEVGVC